MDVAVQVDPFHGPTASMLDERPIEPLFRSTLRQPTAIVVLTT